MTQRISQKLKLSNFFPIFHDRIVITTISKQGSISKQLWSTVLIGQPNTVVVVALTFALATIELLLFREATREYLRKHSSLANTKSFIFLASARVRNRVRWFVILQPMFGGEIYPLSQT